MAGLSPRSHTESKTVGANDKIDYSQLVYIAESTPPDVAYIDLNLPVKEEVHMQIVNQMGQTVASRNYGSMSGSRFFLLSRKTLAKACIL